MIVFAVIIKTGWRLSAPNMSWGRTLATIVILVLLLGLGSCSYKVYRRATTPPPPPQSTTLATKATVLRFDGFTPCDPSIDFAFELDTQGDPIEMKFPSIETPIEYSGKGTLNAPEQRTSGPVHITSLDPRQQARVRIWEVIQVKRP